MDVLELAFQSSPDCIKVLDREGQLLLMNEGGAVSMELGDPSDLVGRRWTDFWTTSDRPMAIAAVAAARSGKIGHCAGFLPTGKGTPKWWQSVITPMFDAAGQVDRLLVVSRDISRQTQLSSDLSTAVRRMHAIVRATSEIVWQADAVNFKGNAIGLSDFTGHDVSTRAQWLELVHPDDRDRVDTSSADYAAAGVDYVFEYRLQHRSGSHCWVEDRVVGLRDDNGQVVEWVGVITNIHDRVIASQALRSSEERLRLAVQASHVGIWDVDLVTGSRQWSTELKDLLGLSHDAEETEALLLGLVHPHDRPLVMDAHADAFRTTSPVSFRIRRADTGAERWLVSQGQPVCDQSGVAVRRLGTMQDVTERKHAEQKLWIAANHDPLTELSNRLMFSAALDDAIASAKANGSRVGLMLIDLDHLKQVNDTLGHEAGDRVLCAMADRLRAVSPPSALVARLGGDEFAILVQNAGAPEDLAVQAERLVRDLSVPDPNTAAALTCTASLGLAVYPDHDVNAGELLKNADVALYAAKRSGRARHAVFEPAMKVTVQKRVAVLRRARDALAGGHIVPFYQPKVTLTGAQACGFEALLRWHDGDTIRPPGDLIEAFDDPDLAAQIGQRMLDRVIADLLAWRAAGLDTGSIALNVAAVEFLRIDVAARWLNALEDAGLPADSLQMEVTESVLLGEEADAVGRALGTLHDSGMSIALDDFGTGFASLKHLRGYPIDWLKIDQSFVRDLEHDDGARAIVSSVIGLAHGLRMQVVAEGVETAIQADMLREQRCDLAQGYLIARPVPAREVPTFLTTWRGLNAAPMTAPAVKARRRPVSGSRVGRV